MRRNWIVLTSAFIVSTQLVSAQTAEDLRVQILNLISQIQMLQGQLTDREALPLPDFCHTFSYDLKFGDSGREVEMLQLALQREGFPIVETELGAMHFGSETAGAVTGFQEKYRGEILLPAGLAAGNGFAGLYTRAKLNNLYGC